MQAIFSDNGFERFYSICIFASCAVYSKSVPTVDAGSPLYSKSVPTVDAGNVHVLSASHSSAGMLLLDPDPAALAPTPAKPPKRSRKPSEKATATRGN